ncbi:MAG: hypothetical protein EOP59_02915 [Sphingomonadales bacterium]|nr:MAG: hypothetical protein EOP59_02915 [Sphingomonadales bacterium]
MPSLTAPFISSLLALAALAGQTAPDEATESARQRLETQRRELLVTLRDKAWMQDQTRASIARLQIGRHWESCAENEALALAKASEKPARLLAESALTACRPWQDALTLALESGAYPYIDGADTAGRASRDDMVTAAQLGSLDAALARIRMWRGMSGGMRTRDAAPVEKLDPTARFSARVAPVPARLAPPEPPAPAREAPVSIDEAGETVTIVAQARGGCRVRFADRTLTEAQLAAKAREWAAADVRLRVIRPRGADYRCMAKIAWQLGEQGMRLFEFVEPQ